ncbi:hypothetical protein [Klebsiella aerogenes]|uniref:hypothetical protein n=1 Tax=Klebsiella aerogenes TaxID=548 RepID=UPI00244C2DCF|nr:hypothetical protein [Klebsiella aerogenes]MDH1612390.1 hypothetical protein [Klebsiella aerogenes]
MSESYQINTNLSVRDVSGLKREASNILAMYHKGSIDHRQLQYTYNNLTYRFYYLMQGVETNQAESAALSALLGVINRILMK